MPKLRLKIKGLALAMLCHFYAAGQNEIKHVILMGQSLGAGEQSLPLVTTAPTGFGNLMFKIGTHTWTKRYYESKPQWRAPDGFNFVPLTAVERGHEGETIGNGLCDHFKDSSDSLAVKNTRLLFSFTGQGGRLIRELDKRHDDSKDPRSGDRRSKGGFYNTVIDDVKKAKYLCDLKQRNYSVMAITWMQGESNRLGHVTRWDPVVTPKESFMKIYTEDLITLKNDLQEDIMAITKQTSGIPFFTYQTAGANIGSAQLIACDTENDMYMVGPTYMMPNAENSRMWATQEHGNYVHLTADGQRWLGEMFGKVIRKVVVEKKKWMPLRPTRAFFSDGLHVQISFYVPAPPLVLDTIFLPKQAKNFGFKLYCDTNICNISSARVINDTTVELSLSQKANTNLNYKLSYGLQSYAFEVSNKLAAVRADTVIDKITYTALEFEGDLMNEFAVIGAEGAFTLGNKMVNDSNITSIAVRKVYLGINGNTVLLGEQAQLRNGVPFRAGQNCYTARAYEYGNLRDSDDETSTFNFADTGYGNRYGKKYPLYNWSVVFEDFPVFTLKNLRPE